MLQPVTWIRSQHARLEGRYVGTTQQWVLGRVLRRPRWRVIWVDESSGAASWYAEVCGLCLWASSSAARQGSTVTWDARAGLSAMCGQAKRQVRSPKTATRALFAGVPRQRSFPAPPVRGRELGCIKGWFHESPRQQRWDGYGGTSAASTVDSRIAEARTFLVCKWLRPLSKGVFLCQVLGWPKPQGPET